MATELTRRQVIQGLGIGLAGSAVLGMTGCGAGGAGGAAGTRLRLSHQWPKSSGKGGDFRSQLAQRFADEVKKQTDGDVQIKLYPNSSLVETDAQYKALQKRTIDLTVFPVVYAVGQHKEFDVTTLPCLIKNHAQADNWQNAEIGGKIDSIFQEAGSKILVWNWNSLMLGAKSGPPIVTPDDVKSGSTWRGAGPRIEELLQHVGASITSMSSSEIYSALQTGVLDDFITSPGSYRSYRLYEQTKSYTSPTENTLGFFFEPLLIAQERFDELPKDAQQALEEAGKNLQDYAYKASKDDDMVTEKKAKEEGVKVATIDDKALAEWREISQPIWEDFASSVKNGGELLDLAKKVPED